ncbi:MAG: helix-turn-helix transcriptional regulator [Prevotella sp.]|nr:helix-turn-helix transcriptional regulator [Candidatus Prevotella equi]
MNRVAPFFTEALANIPPDIKKQVDLSMGVSDRLADILKQKNMTQKDFAKAMGKTQAEVCRWLGGTHNFTFSTIAKISAFLGEDLITIVK